MQVSKETIFNGTRYLTSLPFSMFSGFGDGKTPARADGPAWEEEKEDILERAEWLSQRVITSPTQLLSQMPHELGPNFGGQWAIYSCSMYAVALANISRLFPEEKEKCLERIEKLIDLVLTPEIRRYDTLSFREDALKSLDGTKSHLSYLSLLAWMISSYRLAGGEDTKWDDLYQRCCESLDRRMRASKDCNISTFANGVVFIPDMIPALISLHNYSMLYDGRYEETVCRWKENIRAHWMHEQTGLIRSMSGRGRSGTPRGSYAALTCSYLSMVDEEFAREQYGLMKKHMYLRRSVFGRTLTGVREYLHSAPSMSFDPDAGPIVQGLSASGTAFAIGAATRLGDWSFRRELLATAESAGNTVHGRGSRHYRLAELALVGEAVTLCMRTNFGDL